MDTTPITESHTSAPVRRTLYITGLALINAILIGFLAKGLVLLIGLFTNLFFYQAVSLEESSPSGNHLGYWVILIPVAGGIIVGIMARFGSRAIRGHGIPEAMEKIVKDQSKIPPLVTLLKPLSAAISIGSGGPFGAEGPIISTGGALGSFCGQTLHITSQERKILLAAGATAGMTAIFGTPFAAILLAIELLLFEFSARSFIPVMIACVTGACMHFVLFSTGPTFPMPDVPNAGVNGVVAYAVIGLLVGVASVIVTKILYLIEDGFERLPIHWMWWPAIGGVVVGVVGLIAPSTLGVGYENITAALSGELAVSALVALCFWKFISWSFALGSGTSGGTLAPLLTIGSAAGCLLGMVGQEYFPQGNIHLSMAALVGMSAMFAGSSRALLTSIVFAMETTMQQSSLLPLIAGCVCAYMISFIFMRNTIMTEKIRRRGVMLPDSYHPDVLAITSVGDVLPPLAEQGFLIVNESTPVGEIREWLQAKSFHYDKSIVMILKDDNTTLASTITPAKIMAHERGDEPVGPLAERISEWLEKDDSLLTAVDVMLKNGKDFVPIVDAHSHALGGILLERDVFRAFEQRFHEERHIHRHISMRKKTVEIFIKGKRLLKKTTLKVDEQPTDDVG